MLPTAFANDQSTVARPDVHETTHQQVRIRDNDNNMERRPQRNSELLLPRDEKFDNILREICEAPSACLPNGFLCKEDIRSGGSTLPHYVAARGRLNNVLLEVLLYSTLYGYSVDTLDDDGFTALHVAVQHNRIENVKLLLTAGAQFDTPNPYGELPLHVAILSSKDPGLVEELLFRHGHRMDMQIMGPSKREGQTDHLRCSSAKYGCT
jgi:ankyrin repeat protein